MEILTSTPPGAPDELRVLFPSSGRARVVDVGHSGGTYEHVSTGLNTGTFTMATNRDTHGISAHEHTIIVQMTFTTTTTGTVMYSDNDGVKLTGNFRIIDP